MTLTTRAEDGAPAAGRRRFLTLLFADLCDSTRLAASMEAEHFGELLAALRQIYESVIPRHGGVIVRVQGDGILAMFGHPQTGEDDGRRATEAALDLHRAVRVQLPGAWHASAPVEALHMHSGVHSGLVLVQEGDALRGRFELLGNIPNIAARLADAARRDEILVSEETLGPESHFFLTSPLQNMPLKGWPKPVAAYRILGRAPVGTRFEARVRRGMADFTGREQPMALLQAAYTQAARGAPHCVVLSAAPGMGKTRLVEEFLRHPATRDAQVLRGYCESYLGAEPLQPFMQMLRSLVHVEAGAAAVAAAELLDHFLAQFGIDPALHRANLLHALSITADRVQGAAPAAPVDAQGLHAALVELVGRLAARQPLLMFIDDWQWADQASQQLLSAVRALAGLPMLVILSTRGPAPGDPDMSGAQLVALAPLSDDAAAAAIAGLLPRADPFLVQRIVQDAGGNPLFIEELCHSAAQGDAEWRMGRRAPGTSSWLDGLIESRVARLPAEQVRLVHAAAVMGNVVPAWLFEAITGEPVDSPAVCELAAEDLLFPVESGNALRFKHGVARDVIYASVGLHQRRAMHLRIAEALRAFHLAGPADEACEALAYHYGRAGQHEHEARYAELAGHKALAASALDRAQAQYRAALAAIGGLDPPPALYARWSSIAERLALACVFDPSHDHLDVFRRAVELATAQDNRRLIRLSEYWLGYINYALGELREAVLHCERALALSPPGDDDPLTVQIRATLGQACAASCDYGRALVLLDDALDVKRRHRTGARPAVGTAYTLACKGSVLGDQGQFVQAQACFDEALAVIHDARHEVEGSVLSWRSGVYLWQGRWQEAALTARQAQQVAERVKSVYTFAMSQSLGAYAQWMLTGAPEHVEALANATAWLEARDKGLFISLNYGWLAEMSAAADQPHAVRRYAALALRWARKHDRVGWAMACRALARMAAAGHGRKPAAAYLGAALQAGRARESVREIAVTQLCQAELAIRHSGDQRGAQAALQAAIGTFEALDMRWHLAQALWLGGSDRGPAGDTEPPPRGVAIAGSAGAASPVSQSVGG